MSGASTNNTSSGGIPLDALLQLADSASEVSTTTHSRSIKNNGKVRVEMKSEEDRIRKRQLRLLKNRQSAALSRQRKKEYISDLEVKATGLCTDKSDLEGKINRLTSLTLDYRLQVDKLEKQLHDTTQENNELKARLASLTQGSPQQVESQQRQQHNNNSSSSSSSNNGSSSNSSSYNYTNSASTNNNNNHNHQQHHHNVAAPFSIAPNAAAASSTSNTTTSYSTNASIMNNNNSSIGISSPSLSALVKPAPALTQERILC